MTRRDIHLINEIWNRTTGNAGEDGDENNQPEKTPTPYKSRSDFNYGEIQPTDETTPNEPAYNNSMTSNTEAVTDIVLAAIEGWVDPDSTIDEHGESSLEVASVEAFPAEMEGSVGTIVLQCEDADGETLGFRIHVMPREQVEDVVAQDFVECMVDLITNYTIGGDTEYNGFIGVYGAGKYEYNAIEVSAEYDGEVSSEQQVFFVNLIVKPARTTSPGPDTGEKWWK